MPQITPIAANSTAPRRVIAPPAQVVSRHLLSGVSVHHTPDSPVAAEQPAGSSAQRRDRVGEQPADVTEAGAGRATTRAAPDDDVGDVGCGRCEDDGVQRRPAASPAVRTESSRTATRSAAGRLERRRRRPDSRARAWPPVAAASSAAPAKRPRACAREPLVHLDRRGPPRRGRSRRAVGAQREATPASRSARAGPMPSARSRSVVGHRHDRRPAAAQQRDVVVGQVGRVHRAVRGRRAAPCVVRAAGSASRRTRPRHCVVLAALLGQVHVQRPARRRPATSATGARWSTGTARTE